MRSKNNVYLISYRTLRQWIGVLGILLPLLCWGVNTFVNHFDLLNNSLFIDTSQTAVYIAGADLKPSISDFYYTASGPIFTGILITVAIFLFCYAGYPENKKEDRFSWLTDRRVSAFAACSALGIVTFPTGSVQKITDNIHNYVSSPQAGTLHLIFAALFFLSMATMSIVNFRRHPHKELIMNAEGKLYLTCGVGIVVCILILGIHQVVPGGEGWLWGKFVYIMEVIMLLFFGIAWLTKGKSIPTEFVLEKVQE